MASKAQKALASGPSKIGAKARAAANKLKSAGSGKHSGPAKDLGSGKPGKHAKMTGGRHGKSDMVAAKKNAHGSLDAPSVGKHSSEANTRRSQEKTTAMKERIADRKALRAKVGRK